MKIAIVHDYLHEYGGAEALVNAIWEVFPEADIYSSTYDAGVMRKGGVFQGANVFYPKWKDKIPKQFRRFINRVLIITLPAYFEGLDLGKYDLIISSSAHFAKGVKTNKNQVNISYIHTPPRFLYGYETSMKSRNKWYMKILLWPIDTYLRYKDQQFAKRPDYLICNSKEVQSRIKRIYKRDAEVIYPFPQVHVDEKFYEHVKKEGKSDYFLVISRLSAYKNIDLAINACGSNCLKLQVAGTGTEENYLNKLSDNFRTVEMRGFVDDDEKELLYQNCKAFLGTVKDEDFGMSLLEPMMYGKPVVALRQGGYLETVIENKTGIFFDALTEDSLLEGIKKIDEIKWDADEIRKHALSFSKEKFQENIKNFVEEKLKLSHNS